MSSSQLMIGIGLDGPGAALLGAVVLGVSLMMIVTQRRARDRATPGRSVRQLYNATGLSDQNRRDVEEVMLELDRLARQIHGQLDTRFAKLEAVIRDADERIAQLSRLVREAHGETTLDVVIGDTPASDRPPIDPPVPKPSAFEAVYRLAEEGLRPEQIAAQAHLPVGEVELILALRRTRSASSALASPGGSLAASA